MSAIADHTRQRYTTTDRWRPRQAHAGRCDCCGRPGPIARTSTVHYARLDGTRGTRQESVCAHCWTEKLGEDW